MSKRSDFPRRKHDVYATPYEAVPSLVAHLPPLTLYYEPCVGEGDLVQHLQRHAHQCVGASDIRFGKDALQLTADDMRGAEYIITNPPWTRRLLHPMIEHFVTLVPHVWLLFDGDWMFTKQAAPYFRYLELAVPTPRLKWIPNSKYTAKDNTCWYLFSASPDQPAKISPRRG
jgi:hypothetical protein